MNQPHTLLIGLFAGLLLSPLAQAQSAQIGKALHTANCESSSCHSGTPPRINNSAQKAANNPTVIKNAIRSDKGGMGYLTTLSDTDLADIAKYIGTSSALPALSDADRVLNWAEWQYQKLLQPRSASQEVSAYTIRTYPALYLGVANGQVLMLDRSKSNANVQTLNTLSYFLGMAAADGF